MSTTPEIHVNEEGKLIEFIADDWRFVLWFEKPATYSFVCRSPSKELILEGEAIPGKVIEALKRMLAE